jgi:hypothetical protein
MDVLGGLPTTRKGYDYLFLVVEMFSEMCILVPCKNTIKKIEATNKFFEEVWVWFGIPRRSLIGIQNFSATFWTTLWEKMDTKLKRYTTFHP